MQDERSKGNGVPAENQSHEERAPGQHHKMPQDLQREILEQGAPPIDSAGQPMKRRPSVEEEVLGAGPQSTAPTDLDDEERERQQTGSPRSKPDA